MTPEHPAAAAVRDYQSKPASVERFNALILAFEILLRVDACILATLFLTQDECRNQDVPDLLLTNPKQFTLGTWLKLLRILADTVPESSAEELLRWVCQMDKGRSATFGELLKLRNENAHNESRTDEVKARRNLTRAEILFQRCFDAHPRLGKVIEVGNGRLHIEMGGISLPGGPLLLSGSAVGHSEVVLLYRGSGSNMLEYGSLGGWTYECPVAYAELLEQLHRKEKRLDVVQGVRARHRADERIVQHTQDTLKRLIDLQRYRPEIAIDRSELDFQLEAFLRKPQCLMIVQGASGSGKTFWLCRVVERRLRENRAVLFETADRLAYGPMPESLGSMLRIKDVMEALEAAASRSEDDTILIVLDALETWGREAEHLLSLFHWIERLDLRRKIKIVATIRAERWWLFSDEHEAALPRERVLEESVPVLSLYSLQELARNLPKPPEAEAGSIEAARLEIARQISSLAYESSLQPGLAVAILEAVGTSTVPTTFSAARVYEELFRRVVLNVAEARPGQPWRAAPRQPWRATILRGLAALLLARMADRIALDDTDLEPLHLIETSTGQRTEVYSGLLSDRILAENLESFISYILFIDQHFFEFVASLTLSEGDPSGVVTRLYAKWRRYPSALSVAAFYLTRAIRTIGTGAAIGIVQEIPAWQEPLLLELASVEGEVFLEVLGALAEDQPEKALSLVDRLIEKGRTRLAVDAAEILIDRLDPGSELETIARTLKARALFEIDDYEAAEEEIEQLGDRFTLISLRAEIALSQGHLEKALRDYEALLERPSLSSEERADALGGVGYIRYRFGELTEAENYLREAVSLLEFQDTGLLAETLGDLGQVLMTTGHLHLARECFEQDLAICRRNGQLIGVGVAESLLAKVSLQQGEIEEAEAHFQRALEIARQTGNRWREAWTLKEFVEVCRAAGRSDEAEMYARESAAICEEIGVVVL
jgi:tetratricopeptide (TPR) repeat protein